MLLSKDEVVKSVSNYEWSYENKNRSNFFSK